MPSRASWCFCEIIFSRSKWRARMKKAANSFQSLRLFCGILWCPRRDSNPHTLRHMDLNHARLPIPPRGHCTACCSCFAAARCATEARIISEPRTAVKGESLFLRKKSARHARRRRAAWAVKFRACLLRRTFVSSAWITPAFMHMEAVDGDINQLV